MFATDRDLLVLEPALFRDVGFLGQRLFSGVASVSGSTLTASGADFTAQGVTTGHVALFDGAGLEVTARLSATTLTLSRPRALLGDPVIPPSPASNRPLLVGSFLPQIAIAHAALLAMLNVQPAGSTLAHAILETQITNPRALALAESFLALEHIYTAAAAGEGPGGPLHTRAEMYARRFSAERSRAVALVDLDADGQPDAVQAMAVISLSRA